MFRFDCVLIDPTPETLSQALAQASTATNKGCRVRLLHWPTDDFTGFLTTWANTPERQRQWVGSGAHRKSGPGGNTR